MKARRCYTGRALALALGVQIIGTFAAGAETYKDPAGAVCVSTNGSTSPWPCIATVHYGGCPSSGASTTVSIAVGPSGGCTTEAKGWIAVGLLGADAANGDAGGVVVSDTGTASADNPNEVSLGVSGTGSATGYVAISGGGACGQYQAVAVTRPATCGATAVSLLGGSATGDIAVAPVGTATGEWGAVALGDAHAGTVAVSLTGNACGGSLYSLAPMGHAC